MRQLMSARKVRTTLEQQRQLALLEESQAGTAAQTGGQKNVWPDRGFKGRSTIRTTQAQRDKAVAFAKSQVLARKPYIWGTQGPNSFDCSGLVYAAYKSAGLGWPNWDRLNSALYSGLYKACFAEGARSGRSTVLFIQGNNFDYSPHHDLRRKRNDVGGKFKGQRLALLKHLQHQGFDAIWWSRLNQQYC